MRSKPIVSLSLSSEAFDRVVEAITSGQFEPGERLSEAELARNLGISRGPLREALGRLEGRLVRRTPRIGVHVISLTEDDLESLFLIREALEGMSARLASKRISDDDLVLLRTTLESSAHLSEFASGKDYVQGSTDVDFHFAIIRAARCKRIECLLMEDVYRPLRIHHRSISLPSRSMAALHEHKLIVQAIESRDPVRAETAMRMHLRNDRLAALNAILSDAGQAKK